MTDKEDSPHLAARKATAQMYFACAEEDPWMSLDDVECLRRDLAAHGVKAEVELYAQPNTALHFHPALPLTWPRRSGIGSASSHYYNAHSRSTADIPSAGGADIAQRKGPFALGPSIDQQFYLVQARVMYPS